MRDLYRRGGKRGFDLCLVAMALPLVLPVLACAALSVRIMLGRPVLYRSRRIGRDGVVFTMLKLRSMTEGDGEDRQRLTRFGRVLRASGIDELPQLWHVARGEMSWVGPRPLPSDYRALLPPVRHRVRPGLTGLAQVNGRNALDWETRLRLDVAYAEAPALPRDLAIMMRTAWVLASGQGSRLGRAPPQLLN